MSLIPRFHIASAVHVHLSIPGRQEFDRTIELPEDAPPSWRVDAYRLSLGLPFVDNFEDDDARRRGYKTAWEYRPPQARSMPEFPQGIEERITATRSPPLGAPLVAIVSEQPEGRTGSDGPWQTCVPSLRLELVNHELMQRYGVVRPYFDTSRIGGNDLVSSSSRLASLLTSLEPVRRLALQAHLEAVELLAVQPFDLNVVEPALSSLRALVAYLGVDGLTQDPKTGWILDEDLGWIIRDLGWDSAESDTVAVAGEMLLSFARALKAIRRFNGRVIVTRTGRRLLKPTPRTLQTIADAIVQPDPNGHSLIAFPAKEVLALLAVADGSADTLADLQRLALLGEAVIDTTLRGKDEVDIWSAPPVSIDSRVGASRAIEPLVGRLAAMSEPGRFGMISPAMRAVARTALL